MSERLPKRRVPLFLSFLQMARTIAHRCLQPHVAQSNLEMQASISRRDGVRGLADT